MLATRTRLRALHAKAIERNQWPLAYALAAAASDDASLDHRINVVGAMHEAGLLRNSLQPWWTAWRPENDAQRWTHRCLERIVVSDHDYWAVAGLLGLPLGALRTALARLRFQLLSIRFAQSFKGNDHHIATFSLKHFSSVISPVLEVGWDTITGEVVDISRWRAVILRQQTIENGNLIGHGHGSYFIRASLPYGGRRIVEDEFRLLAEWCVPHNQTLLSVYP